MAKKPVEANVNTTDLEVPVTMHIEGEPAAPSEEIPIFKDEAREAIFAKRRQQVENELASLGLDSAESAVDDAPEHESPEIPAEPTADAQLDTSPIGQRITEPAAGTQPQGLISIKVEGREIEVPLETLTVLAQKGLSSTKTWEEAARMREEAQRLMFSMQQNQNTQQQAAPQNVPLKEQSIPTDKAREILKRINYGSEEEQIAGLLDLGATIEAKVQGRSQGLPQEQVIQVATQQALAAIRSEQEQAILWSEYNDILSDPPLSSAADLIAQQLARQYSERGQQISRLDLLREAGKITRERYVMPRQVPPTPIAAPSLVNINNDKLERKRAAPKPPVAANRVSSTPNPQDGVSPSSIVNRMRQARGQPIYT